jgi:hypothetical protein
MARTRTHTHIHAMATSPALAPPRADVAPSEGAPQLAAPPPPPPAAVESAHLAATVASLSGAAAALTAAASSLRALASAQPELLASSGELRDALAAVSAGAAAVAAAAAPAARAPDRDALLLPLPPPTLEDVAPYIAQAGHHALADSVLAQLNRYLRSEERIWRAISKLPLGLHGRTRLMYAAHSGDAAALLGRLWAEQLAENARNGKQGGKLTVTL